MKRIVIFTLMLMFAHLTYAQPKLFSSDWPVWNLTEGMNEKGLLNDFDYSFKNYETALKWFKAGNVDVTFMTLYDFISMQPTKQPTLILGVTDYSNGGDKLILRNTIKKAEDLRGKKVLLASNTISLWLLHNYLEKHGMNLNDVQIINKSVNSAPLLFKEDKSYAAVVGWNPNIEKALDESSYVGSTSRDYPRAIYDLIVAKESFHTSSKDLSKKLLQSYFRSLTDKEVIESTAMGLSVSEEEYRLWLDDAKIFETWEESNLEYQHLVNNAERIRIFLSKAPTTIRDEETRKRFMPRDIDILDLIGFQKVK
ncbi:hypothetical protein A9Q99_05860 [Gammaproteobacteria bacterium 45_16_T64]|nr:hypothetical protein A9Q99_05860 [Gammaproteobacteria bacterium 45_16_T64]